MLLKSNIANVAIVIVQMSVTHLNLNRIEPERTIKTTIIGHQEIQMMPPAVILQNNKINKIMTMIHPQ